MCNCMVRHEVCELSSKFCEKAREVKKAMVRWWVTVSIYDTGRECMKVNDLQYVIKFLFMPGRFPGNKKKS